jgi:hypothetical protein
MFNLVCKITVLKKEDRYGDDNLVVWSIIVLVLLYSLGRFSYGIYAANNKDRCIVNSIADVLIAPSYAFGCVIGKDRFNVRLN